ncbi:MAG: GNAT family N-acetyltransferase [Pikeienuella sp.]
MIGPQAIEAAAPGGVSALAEEVLDLLDAHAEGVGHPFVPEQLGFALREQGRLVAGITGHLTFGWLFIKFLAVAPEQRGRGIGSALLARIEQTARAAGAIGAMVDTYGFQAEGFYLAHGYRVLGRLETPDPALTRIYLSKRFEAVS